MDLVDESTEYMQRTMKLHTAEIMAAVSVMQHGDASAVRTCVSCGELIPQKRVQAIPGCTRCVTCQQKFEMEID